MRFRDRFARRVIFWRMLLSDKMDYLPRYLAAVLLLLLLFFQACKKEEVLPPNPYDGVDYSTDDPDVFQSDPNSIVGIYESILRVKCATPGCHDGHFEPDYRSIQSSWSTLVYHQVVKNTADSAYSYRVVPGDTGQSMLWKRLTTGNAQLQQMPATGSVLSPGELTQIRTWIENGARDMFGNLPLLPNNEPTIVAYLAYDQAFSVRFDEADNRLDSLFYNPFKIPHNTTMNLVFLVEDDSTAIPNMQVNQLRLSLDKDDFAGAQTVNAFYFNAAGGIWVAPVNSGNFAVGDTVYFRYRINDGDQTFNTEFPRDDQPDPYKTYASFFVTP